MNISRTIAALTAASMISVSVPAWADTPVPAPTISPLDKGQPAPYAGVLLSTAASAAIIAQHDTAAQAVAIAVQHQAAIDADQQKFALDTAATTCTADKNVLNAQITDYQKQNQILQDQLKKETSGPGAGVWLGLGAAGGIVVTVLTAFAISKATK